MFDDCFHKVKIFLKNLCARRLIKITYNYLIILTILLFLLFRKLKLYVRSLAYYSLKKCVDALILTLLIIWILALEFFF